MRDVCEAKGRRRENALEKDCMSCDDYSCQHRKQMRVRGLNILSYL